MSQLLQRRPDLLPSVGLAIGAMLWGLFWIPVRGVEQAGIAPVWIGPIIFGTSILVFLPFAVFRWKRLFGNCARFATPVTLAGLAFSLWAISLITTDVVRALLLFYLTPVWSTALGVLFLRERLTANRVVALLLALLGLVVVLGIGEQFPWPRNLGDWLALASGWCWSLASLGLFQGGGRQVFDKVFLFVFCAFATSVLLALVPWGIATTTPGAVALTQAAPWIVAFAVLQIPVAFLTIWPASVLSPGRTGMLLMGDLVVGVASAAALAGEPFGIRELAGTLLIGGAAVIEVAKAQTVTARSV